MSWQTLLGWESLSYLGLLLLLWLVIRHFADHLPDIWQLLYINESLHVNIWKNNVYYPVSYWTEKGGKSKATLYFKFKFIQMKVDHIRKIDLA